jgi:hypothetical protein
MNYSRAVFLRLIMKEKQKSKPLKNNGGSDGTRTRGLRRDRPSIKYIKSGNVPTITPELAVQFLAQVGTGERRLAIVREYSELHAVARARADELQLARTMLDDISGNQPGYSAKLLAPIPIKGFGPATLGPTLGGLGLALIVIEDKEALARIAGRLEKKKRPDPHASLGSLPAEFRIAINQTAASIVKDARSEWSRKANEARNKLPKRERRRIARLAARARWKNSLVINRTQKSS